jgi:hypothetical protein
VEEFAEGARNAARSEHVRQAGADAADMLKIPLTVRGAVLLRSSDAAYLGGIHRTRGNTERNCLRDYSMSSP